MKKLTPEENEQLRALVAGHPVDLELTKKFVALGLVKRDDVRNWIPRGSAYLGFEGTEGVDEIKKVFGEGNVFVIDEDTDFSDLSRRIGERFGKKEEE